jgi:LmbE family N-acetylglucosaminyl deacetylase
VRPDARNAFAFPTLLASEGLEAWAVPEVWVLASPQPDRYVDVTDTFDLKIAALQAHVTQTAHVPDLADRLRRFLAANAMAGGLPEGRLAEAFRVVSIPT